MSRLWLVAKQEYKKRAGQRSFIFGTMVFPLLFGIIITVTVYIFVQKQNHDPFGYVDYSGVLADAILPADEDEEMVEMVAFADEAAAQAALEAGEIQGYHVVPADYLETLEVDLYYLEERPASRVLRDFDQFVRANLLRDAPNPVQERISSGVDLIIQSSDGKREFREEIGFVAVIFPLIVALFFFFAVMGSAGYFLQAVTDEKESRTMEIVMTSVSPEQLIGGKSLGLLGVALTQITIWFATLILGWNIARYFVDELQFIRLPWDILIVFALYFLPTFALIAGIMLAIGAAVTELQEAQQISGALNLLFTFPLFMMALMFADPDAPFIVALSLWPTTSFMTITLRWGFTIVPFWQLAASWVILVGAAVFSIWAAARIFRLGMLRYGQRLTFKAVLGAIRPANGN